MLTIDPKELPIPKLHHYLLGSIGPRPIAFASTIDAEGNRNLAPFSFFNVFSANPPILIFSPARSGRTNTTKNTHDNVKTVPEVVINVVTYDMVHQMSLTSSPFEAGVDEFEKAGFTPIASDTIRPFRVKESPVQIECKVLEIKELGQNGGAGNLVICEVQKIHIDERVLDENQMVDQKKIDLVSRMGGNWYCRANDTSMFEVDKPITTIGVGVDSLPINIRTSSQLTGNDLGILGNMLTIPTDEEIKAELSVIDIPSLSLAKDLLNKNKPQMAYAVLTQVL
ncbi:flavin reductase family protein [Bacteroidia bacterium]|nr:flavin reductase family protein [Bacteroidia bacterium]MDB0055142.1 flavin reductase family protein [Bacteroidia bacterium]MDC0104812.1 flavin reductase family protein [Bacteroidia bacterium]